MSNLLEVKSLHSLYGESHVLHGVSFSLDSGQALSLMGRNGMGKTTTLKSILGLVTPRSGTVSFKGENITNLATWQRMKRDIAYVPEGRGMFHNLTVKEHLQVAARANNQGEKTWDYDRVLDTFPRLKERLSNLGTQLSGGEQQMLAIGRALVTNPELLILDEATEGLAPLIRKEIWEVIRTIKESGISTIIVDKNIQVLQKLCDRHVVLVKGKVVMNLDAEQLQSNLAQVEGYLGV
ncbi:ABC transporter ATP-binding protein [Marinomonas sp. UCMA 3892]|jgi:branched-chain amino acid transport system ATP-binding protein|uniref:ABC transporter ATP-binding protein n=1 Tax=Marinomonas TaxID=28253 RepID=UPI000C1E8819|nr:MULTISPECIES: ABC transporter ATP-binding protein [unclassified Marinomonas]MBU1293784.1 ABC transporter ATP-binding protein [Gammaproteobacteria bacterium]MBU1465275.1 ABC transporter ATP-binding protein [Gammaproteobacteria bacterium]MBU2024011.1 ABC transporter ATP-binding protein [Gammaproteobacteria bacterium]MBU2240353.1 ABC transporter ATP-binding protein [Gammaproteobacteria bacterium]MBU2317741.1 ABC transporter ATP-binding protein [Gammaproteobacteria bacterium]|tara:strand:- start:6204 stop:6914 length:711 start_codon:yes stop_codon:yes gene_type:complete